MEIQFSNHILELRGKLFDLKRPLIMGILNATPDSFYSGSRVKDLATASQYAGKMLEQGADIIDIGAYSSRPGASDISESEELERLIPIVEKICAEYPEAIVSVDTFRARVARKAITAGAHIINDISAGDDDHLMLATAAELQVPIILMHKQGNPQNMQSNPNYKDVLNEVLDYGKRRIEEAKRLGVKSLIFDPGFGFGKTSAHNYSLLKDFDAFHELEVPLLAGVSRKGMIWKNLEITANEALNGSTALHAWLLERGAGIIRVHDVREAHEVRKLFAHLTGTTDLY